MQWVKKDVIRSNDRSTSPLCNSLGFSCSSDLTIKHDKIRTELELRGEVQMAEIELELRKRGEVEAQVGNSSKKF